MFYGVLTSDIERAQQNANDERTHSSPPFSPFFPQRPFPPSLPHRQRSQPHSHFPLPSCLHRHDDNHTHNNPFHVISSSLSKALLHFYPLVGTLRHRQHPNCHLELWCTAGQGVPLIHATVDFTLDSVNYLSDPNSPFIEHFVLDPKPEEGMEHPCILQLTVFKCGGFTLGAAICDGLGANHLFNAWAELARWSTKISMEPVWDRDRLLGPRNPPRVDSPLIGEFLSLDKRFSPDIGGFVR